MDKMRKSDWLDTNVSCLKPCLAGIGQRRRQPKNTKKKTCGTVDVSSVCHRSPYAAKYGPPASPGCKQKRLFSGIAPHFCLKQFHSCSVAKSVCNWEERAVGVK